VLPRGLLLPQHMGADTVGGHQVWGELDAGEVKAEDLAQSAHKYCLAKAGHTL